VNMPQLYVLSLLHGHVTASCFKIAHIPRLLEQQQESQRICVHPALWRLLSYSHSLDTIARRS